MGLMLVRRGNGYRWRGQDFELPFGYHVEHRGDLLVLLRPNQSLVAAFSAMGPDPFEVEAAVWEDAD